MLITGTELKISGRNVICLQARTGGPQNRQSNRIQRSHHSGILEFKQTPPYNTPDLTILSKNDEMSG